MKDSEKEKKTGSAPELIETLVTKRIEEGLEYALRTGGMTVVSGPTGRGKTFTASAWAARQDPERVKMIRVPSGCSRAILAQTLCRAFGLAASGPRAIAEARIAGAAKRGDLIVVDEAGHLLPRAGRSLAPIELLRDLHDMKGIGVALIFTDVYMREFAGGPAADYLEQFRGRTTWSVPIPSRIFQSEIEAIAKAFAPDAGPRLLDLAMKIASGRAGKLRTLFEDLRRAAEFARCEGGSLTAEKLRLAQQWRESGGVWPAR